MIWSSLFSFLLLCTTKFWLPSHLQNRMFQSISLHRIPWTSWFAWQGDKQKNNCQSGFFFKRNFVLSTYQALKFENFNFGWCRNCNFPFKLRSTAASQECRRSRNLLDFTWRRRCISHSDPESECQSKREEKLGTFQNLSVRSCEGCTHMVALLMGWSQS